MPGNPSESDNRNEGGVAQPVAPQTHPVETVAQPTVITDSAPKPSDVKTKTSIPSITKMLDDPYWASSPNVMALAMAAKKESRNKKGESFDCFVLKRPDAPDQPDEFIQFLDSLESNLDNISGPLRFQLAVHNQHHWRAFDVLITPDKQIKLISIDGANLSGDDTLEVITARFPKCQAYHLEADTIPNDTRATRRLIQSDNESCSRMALEHIFRLSKTNLFDTLSATELPTRAQVKQKTEKSDTITSVDDRIKIVSTEQMLDKAPTLYRVTQYWRTAQSFNKKQMSSIVSSKGYTLGEYMAKHSEKTTIGNKDVTSYEAINYKKERFTESIQKFCKKHGEEGVQEVLDGRKNWQLDTLGTKQHHLSQLHQHSLKSIMLNVIEKLVTNGKEQQQLVDSRYEKVKNNPEPVLQMHGKMMWMEGLRELRKTENSLLALRNEIEKIPDSLNMSQQKECFEKVFKGSLAPTSVQIKLNKIAAEYFDTEKVSSSTVQQATTSIQDPVNYKVLDEKSAQTTKLDLDKESPLIILR